MSISYSKNLKIYLLYLSYIFIFIYLKVIFYYLKIFLFKILLYIIFTFYIILKILFYAHNKTINIFIKDIYFYLFRSI